MIIALAEDLEIAAVLDRREAVIAVATGEVSAAALHADWLVMSTDARLPIDPTRHIGLGSAGAAMLGALVWRMGTRARRFLLSGPAEVNAEQAWEWGIADALVPDGVDPLQWTRQWASSRSGLAFDAAALLLRSRGGDPLERAMFAWLFSTGEPQEGLRAFLEKRPARFRR